MVDTTETGCDVCGASPSSLIGQVMDEPARLCAACDPRTLPEEKQRIAELRLVAKGVSVSEEALRGRVKTETYYSRCRTMAVKRWERAFLYRALVKADWNVTRAADFTGIDRSNFRRLLKRHGISTKKPEIPSRKLQREMGLHGYWWLSPAPEYK